MDSIQHMINDLFKQSKWQEWDIQIENNPQVLQSRTLAIPELEHNLGADQQLFVNERLLKQMPVFQSDNLKEAFIFIVTNKRNYEGAMYSIKCLQQC